MFIGQVQVRSGIRRDGIYPGRRNPSWDKIWYVPYRKEYRKLPSSFEARYGSRTSSTYGMDLPTVLVYV